MCWWGGNLEIKIMEDNRFFKQALETAKNNKCELGDTIDAFNQKVNKSGVSPTITTRPEGFKTAILTVDPIIYDDYNGKVRNDQSTVGTITTTIGNNAPRNGQKVIEKTMRVRKLTEQECFKLMGVKPSDYKRVRKNQSKSSCYHLAGDSIVTTCLMALFGQMLDIDWKEKVQKTVEDIIK